MSRVWYRPRGTRRLGGVPSTFHLWYRARSDGHPETTTIRRTDWTHSTPSIEFTTMEEFLASGVGYRVKEAGCMVPWDEDLEMDEGL